MNETPAPSNWRRMIYRSPMLGIVALYVAVWFFLAKWPVAQMYAISLIGIAALGMVAWRANNSASTIGRHQFQFSLGTLMLWVVPYASIAALILSYKGPYEKEFLNANAKSLALLVLTQIFSSIMIVKAAKQQSRHAASADNRSKPNGT